MELTTNVEYEGEAEIPANDGRKTLVVWNLSDGPVWVTPNLGFPWSAMPGGSTLVVVDDWRGCAYVGPLRIAGRRFRVVETSET